MLGMPILLSQIRPDAERAFIENLYFQNRRLMYWAAWRACGEKQELDDIVSEACLALVCKVSDLMLFSDSVLRAYVISVVRRTAYAHMRAARRHAADAVGEDELRDLESGDDPHLDKLIREEMIERMLSAIRRLPERERELIEMRYALELSTAEIAGRLGVTESTVRSALSRARSRAWSIVNTNGEAEGK